jgi:enamine deaminase RidA (YjgF/YER057c/UK114 family)
MSSPESKIAELGLVLPPPPAAAGSYVPSVLAGSLLYCAGTLPMRDGKLTHAGQVGREQTTASGAQAAEVCALNTLANIRAALGSLDRVERIVFMTGFVNAVDGYTDSPAVINGASELFLRVFGEAGRHARAAVAVCGLPRGATAEIQVVVEVRK